MSNPLKSPIILASLVAVLFTIPLLVESLTAWILPLLGLALLGAAIATRQTLARVVTLPVWERELDAALDARERGAVVWCCLDQIDGFRSGYGDLAAEAVLTRHQRMLKEAASDSVVLAREGDAFLLRAPRRDDLQVLLRAVTEVLEVPVDWKGETLQMTASVGGVRYPDHDASARLLRELARLEARNHHVKKTSSLIELGCLLTGLP